MQHFRKILDTIEVQPLLHQVAEHPELWGADNAWTANKPAGTAIEDVSTIVLRYNKTPAGMPSGMGWNRPAFGVLSAAQKIIFDLMRVIPSEHLGKVLITKLPPGGVIDWHIDQWPPGIPLYWHRFQIPLHVREQVIFQVEEEELFMQPGTAWWFNNQRNHRVVNNSDEDRISMLCDICPFSAD